MYFILRHSPQTLRNASGWSGFYGPFHAIEEAEKEFFLAHEKYSPQSYGDTAFSEGCFYMIVNGLPKIGEHIEDYIKQAEVKLIKFTPKERGD